MYQQYQEGWIEVICGCMFAGKSEELIRRIHVLSYAKKKIQVFKPMIDDRYAADAIVSHNGHRIPCYAVTDADALAALVEVDSEVIAIDEVQFFGDGRTAGQKRICHKADSGLCLLRSAGDTHPAPGERQAGRI